MLYTCNLSHMINKNKNTTYPVNVFFLMSSPHVVFMCIYLCTYTHIHMPQFVSVSLRMFSLPCLWAYISVYNTCAGARAIYIYIYIYIHTYTHTHIQTWAHIHTYTFKTHTCMNSTTHTYHKSDRAYVGPYTYKYIQHAYIFTHTHTHTRQQWMIVLFTRSHSIKQFALQRSSHMLKMKNEARGMEIAVYIRMHVYLHIHAYLVHQGFVLQHTYTHTYTVFQHSILTHIQT
jgi:hypothetical protein